MSPSWASGALAAVTLALLLGACGGEDRPSFDELPLMVAPPLVETPVSTPTDFPPPASVAPSVEVTATPPATTTSPSAAPDPRPPLADGRHPVYLSAADGANGTVTVDVVQFFTGTAATMAATEDGAAEVPPPNDYWVRNRESGLRTLSLAPDARITVNTLAAQETGSSRKDLEITLAKLAGYPNLVGRLFWVTASGGTLTVIAEQYLP